MMELNVSELLQSSEVKRLYTFLLTPNYVISPQLGNYPIGYSASAAVLAAMRKSLSRFSAFNKSHMKQVYLREDRTEDYLYLVTSVRVIGNCNKVRLFETQCINSVN